MEEKWPKLSPRKTEHTQIHTHNSIIPCDICLVFLVVLCFLYEAFFPWSWSLQESSGLQPLIWRERERERETLGSVHINSANQTSLMWWNGLTGMKDSPEPSASDAPSYRQDNMTQRRRDGDGMHPAQIPISPSNTEASDKLQLTDFKTLFWFFWGLSSRCFWVAEEL